jgi:hypothetical protein
MITFFRQMGSTVALALVGSLFGASLSHELEGRLAEATRGLPVAMADRFSQGTHGADAESGLARGHFEAEKVKAQLSGQLDGAKRVAKRALEGDRLAAALVEQSPLADEHLKAVAAAGGVKAQVAKSFEPLRERLERAAESPEAWRALQAATGLPAELQRQVLAVPAEEMVDPSRRAKALREVQRELDSYQALEGQRALAQATQEVDRAVDGGKAKLFAAVDAVGAALKVAFTEAIRRVFALALALVVVSFLLTLRLPHLPLRGAAGPAAPAAE